VQHGAAWSQEQKAGIRAHLPRIRRIFIVVAAIVIASALYLWLVDGDVIWLGLAGSSGGIAAGAVVRLVFQQRQHRALVGWCNGLAALVALVTCAVRFDIWLASIGVLILAGELVVAIQQLVKQKVDDAR
jgi:ABC-type Fe3+-siderophore transport system permease subunit